MAIAPLEQSTFDSFCLSYLLLHRPWVNILVSLIMRSTSLHTQPQSVMFNIRLLLFMHK